MKEIFEDIKALLKTNDIKGIDPLSAKTTVRTSPGAAHAPAGCVILPDSTLELMTLREVMELEGPHYCLVDELYEYNSHGISKQINAIDILVYLENIAAAPCWDDIKIITNAKEAERFSDAMLDLFNFSWSFNYEEIEPLTANWLHYTKGFPLTSPEIISTFDSQFGLFADSLLDRISLEAIRNNSSKTATSLSPSQPNLEKVKRTYLRDLESSKRFIIALEPLMTKGGPWLFKLDMALMRLTLEKLNPGQTKLFAVPEFLFPSAVELHFVDIDYNHSIVDWVPTSEELLTAAALFENGMSISKAMKSAKRLK